MRNEFSLKDFIGHSTWEDAIFDVRDRFVLRRKELKISQKALAIKSGVSYPSIRRFEEIGQISFESLLKLADAIDCLGDFDYLFAVAKITNLKDYKP